MNLSYSDTSTGFRKTTISRALAGHFWELTASSSSGKGELGEPTRGYTASHRNKPSHIHSATQGTSPSGAACSSLLGSSLWQSGGVSRRSGSDTYKAQRPHQTSDPTLPRLLARVFPLHDGHVLCPLLLVARILISLSL